MLCMDNYALFVKRKLTSIIADMVCNILITIQMLPLLLPLFSKETKFTGRWAPYLRTILTLGKISALSIPKTVFKMAGITDTPTITIHCSQSSGTVPKIAERGG